MASGGNDILLMAADHFVAASHYNLRQSISIVATLADKAENSSPLSPPPMLSKSILNSRGQSTL